MNNADFVDRGPLTYPIELEPSSHCSLCHGGCNTYQACLNPEPDEAILFFTRFAAFLKAGHKAPINASSRSGANN